MPASNTDTMVLLAQTSKGLFDVLDSELRKLGFDTKKSQDGIYFDNKNKSLNENCYLANLHLRTATRILINIKSCEVGDYDELYQHVFDIDFSKFITVSQTIKMEADVVGSTFKDSRFVSLKAKDAVADRFRKDCDNRPYVDKENPDLIIYIKIYHNMMTVFLDSSGITLSKRGYRKHSTKTPLREHMAAGILLLSNWDQNSPVVDPMCGSGTILIEAALIALNSAPGLFRNSFSFQKWTTFDDNLWSRLLEEAESNEKESLDYKFYGSDISGNAIDASISNAKKAGVIDHIDFKAHAVDDLECNCNKGIVIVNPPYGERLDSDRLTDDYKDLSYALKHKMKGWTSWVLSSDSNLTRNLAMKACEKFSLLNGAIPCKLMRYDIL